jgi:hypothetical protein
MNISLDEVIAFLLLPAGRWACDKKLARTLTCSYTLAKAIAGSVAILRKRITLKVRVIWMVFL